MPDNIQRIIAGQSPFKWSTTQANKLLRLSNQNRIPIDLMAILPLRKIDPRIKYDNLINHSARLIPNQSGFQIIVDESLRTQSLRRMLRFTIAHEIGHTFLFDIERLPPTRFSWLSSFDRSEEKLCNIFASALLMPDEIVLQQYEKLKENLFLRILRELAFEFDVSYSAMAMKLIHHMSLWNGILIACRWLPKRLRNKYDINQKDVHNEEAWRIYWSVIPKSLSKDLYIPRPTNSRKFAPSLKWEGIDVLSKKSKPFEINKFDITAIEAGRLGNLRKILHKCLGVRSNYCVWGTVLEQTGQKYLEEDNNINLESEKTILLTIGLSENVTELSKAGLNNQTNLSNKGIKTDRLREGNLQLSLPFNKSGKTKG